MIEVVLGTVGVVLLLVVVGFFVDRKLPILPRSQRAHPLPPAPVAPVAPLAAPAGGGPVVVPARPLIVPGETASAAVKVPVEWRGRIAAGRCGCGHALEVKSDEAIRFDGRQLVVVRLACTACPHARSVYLEPSL